MKTVVTSTILLELITLNCLLAYLEMYGNHHIKNSAHEHVRPPLIRTMYYGDTLISMPLILLAQMVCNTSPSLYPKATTLTTYITLHLLDLWLQMMPVILYFCLNLHITSSVGIVRFM